jgi:tetratricopeptide (TPR) repeat protein
MKHLKLLNKCSLILSVSMVFLCFSFSAQSRDNKTCGIIPGAPLDNGTNGYGPWDFTNPKHAWRIPKVLGAHFTTNVERLIKGQSASIMGDIDYTLRAIPNYHRALFAVSKYERLKKPLSSIGYTADCYFKRAMHFAPADSIVRMLYGLHLHLSGKHDDALVAYTRSIQLNDTNPEVHYNLGLLYADMKKYNQAHHHAELAYEKGYPLMGLKNRLKENGYYQ